MKGSFAWWLVLGFFLMLAQPAQAHLLATNGSVGAVLHINPADDPAAGQPSQFFWEFQDTKKKFKPALCACVAHIKRGGQEIAQTPLQFSNNEGYVDYTFPARDVYEVVVQGSPLAGGTFTPFTLHYDVRVEHEAATSPTILQVAASFSHHLVHLILFGGGAVFMSGMILKERWERRKGRLARN